MRHLSPGRQAALLMIDFVNAYVTPGSPLYGEGCVAAQRPAAQLLAAARAAGIPRLHTNVAYERGGRNGGFFFRKVAALSLFEAGRDPQFGAFAAGLAPEPEQTNIHQAQAGVFLRTSL